MREHDGVLTMLCRVYDVSRFGYQSWKTRGLSARHQKDIELTDSIERIFGEVNGIYGSPKIHQAFLRRRMLRSYSISIQ